MWNREKFLKLFILMRRYNLITDEEYNELIERMNPYEHVGTMLNKLYEIIDGKEINEKKNR